MDRRRFARSGRLPGIPGTGPIRDGRKVGDTPRQVWAAWDCAWTTPLEGLDGAYDHLVVAGMGGSAIAGDLVADLASLKEGVPVTVVRTFAYLSRFTTDIDGRVQLLGNTEETLSMFRRGLDSDAGMVTVTAGGRLAQESAQHNVPALLVDAPGEPRSAAVYNFMLMAGLLARLGLLDTEAVDVEAGFAALAKRVGTLSPDTPTRDNAAKTLALGLLGHLPLVCGGELFWGSRRWKSQLNENAKVWGLQRDLAGIAPQLRGSLRLLANRHPSADGLTAQTPRVERRFGGPLRGVGTASGTYRGQASGFDGV